VSLHRHAGCRRSPSFPTRRSSDLGVLRRFHPDRVRRAGGLTQRAADALLEAVIVALELVAALETLGELLDLLGVLDRHRLFKQRSEEHTSELQSRENLVCRLLLEK